MFGYGIEVWTLPPRSPTVTPAVSVFVAYAVFYRYGQDQPWHREMNADSSFVSNENRGKGGGRTRLVDFLGIWKFSPIFPFETENPLLKRTLKHMGAH